jgi:hypothetical protein
VRPQLAAHGRRRRLVEEPETRVDLAALHERPALPHQREHLRVAVAEAAGDLECAVEVGDCRREVTSGEQGVDRLREGDAAVLGGFLQPFEVALCRREPAVRDGERPAPCLVPGERQRDAGGRERLSLPGEGGVRALAQRDRLGELAAPPRSLAVPLQVLGGQACGVELLVGVERLAPGLAGRGLAGGGERIDLFGQRSRAAIVPRAASVASWR